jgi:hypothetical protein
LKDVKTAHAWKFEVEQDELWKRVECAIGKFAPTPDIVDRLLAVRSDVDAVFDAGFFEGAKEEEYVIFAIFN